MTHEASESARGESQDNDDVEHSNIDTEFQGICCNYPKKLTGKCFSFDPATILKSMKFLCWGGTKGFT